MFGYHTEHRLAFDNQNTVVLLEDIDHGLHIHIRWNRGKTRLHEVVNGKCMSLVHPLLFYCLYNYGLGYASDSYTILDNRKL